MRLRAVVTTLLALGATAPAADRVDFELTVLEKDLCFACGVYAVGDIDRDGKDDIVAGGKNPRLWWARYPDIDVKLPIAESAALGLEIHLADVDRDGDLDVLSSGGGITWWENPLKPDGNPATDGWTTHEFGSHGTGSNGGSHDFSVGDIDGDGKVDAVERNKERPWTFYLQSTPTSFDIFTLDAATKTEGTALADLDNDGDLDITDGVAWFECPEDPANGTWRRHDLGPNHHMTRVAVGDLSGDQHPDIVVAPAEFGGSRTLWWEAPVDPRTGVWTEHVLFTHEDPNFHTLRIGDLDLDGNNDIVLGTTAYHDPPWGKRIIVFYNTNGDGSDMTEQQWESPRGAWQGVVGDVGGDGDLEILTANYENGQFELWENMRDPAGTGARRSSTGAPGFVCGEPDRIMRLNGRAVCPGSLYPYPGRARLPGGMHRRVSNSREVVAPLLHIHGR